MHTSTHTLARRAPILAAAASLLLAPCLFAQTPAPAAKDTPVAAAPAPDTGATVTPVVTRLEFEPDVIVFTATVSAGDTVPVRVEGQPKVFDTRVKKVSAKEVEIERFDGDYAHKMVLSRGSGHFSRVGDIEYLFEYPEAKASFSEGKATLSIRRMPENSLVRAATTEMDVALYTMRFGGGGIPELKKMLNKAFPKDSLVATDFVQATFLRSFYLRNVRLAEIGRTLEFLSEGKLKVEVVENAKSGNIWRIGSANPSVLAASVKTRSVSAPNLFSDKKALAEIQDDAERIERQRLDAFQVQGTNLRTATVRPLASQKIFVIIGDEEGVAGLEGFIKAAEQRLADAAAAKVAAFAANAPKICVVLTPHVFADAERANKLTESLNTMGNQLMELRMDIEKELGKDIIMRAPWAEARPRPEQKVFVLSGTEAGIAGMESLIKAAEQLAAEEDAKLSAAKAVIEDLKQQLGLAERTLVQEKT